MFHAFVYLYNFVLGYGLYEDQGHHSSRPQEEHHPYEKVRFYGCLSSVFPRGVGGGVVVISRHFGKLFKRRRMLHKEKKNKEKIRKGRKKGTRETI